MKDQYTPELISSLADSLNAGLTCYLNPDSLEVIEVPKALFDDFDSENLEDFQSDLDRVESEWDNCITIEPPEPFESFKFMEQFARYEVQDKSIQERLIFALSNGKPFRNFKNIVESSSCRQQWFDFHQLCLEEYVRDQLTVGEWVDEAEEAEEEES
jgi:hypothetical protein